MSTVKCEDTCIPDLLVVQPSLEVLVITVLAYIVMRMCACINICYHLATPMIMISRLIGLGIVIFAHCSWWQCIWQLAWTASIGSKGKPCAEIDDYALLLEGAK